MSGKRRGLVRTRITFGAILLAALSGLMVIDGLTETGYGLAFAVALVTALGTAELLRMLDSIAPCAFRGPAIAFGPALALVQLAAREGPLAGRLPPEIDLLLLTGFLLVLGAVGLRREPSKQHLLGLVLTAFAVVYVIGLASFAMRLRYIGDHPMVPGRFRPLDLGFAAVLYAVLASKGTDICAFFTGRALGRRKMIPWISPGKTWAGGVGALAGGVAITLGFLFWTPLGTVIAWPAGVALGILVAAVTMVGDLVESLVKRSTAVKDSGSLVPEFGGVLDIVDSILYCLPVVYAAVLLAAAR